MYFFCIVIYFIIQLIHGKKLKERAYFSSTSDLQQHAALTDLKGYKERYKRFFYTLEEDSFVFRCSLYSSRLQHAIFQLPVLASAYHLEQKKKLLSIEGGSVVQNKNQLKLFCSLLLLIVFVNATTRSRKDILFNEQAVTETYRGMIQMLRREMEQGNCVLERLGLVVHILSG